jgi:hypothetical protein
MMSVRVINNSSPYLGGGGGESLIRIQHDPKRCSRSLELRSPNSLQQFARSLNCSQVNSSGRVRLICNFTDTFLGTISPHIGCVSSKTSKALTPVAKFHPAARRAKPLFESALDCRVTHDLFC